MKAHDFRYYDCVYDLRGSTADDSDALVGEVDVGVPLGGMNSGTRKVREFFRYVRNSKRTEASESEAWKMVVIDHILFQLHGSTEHYTKSK